jgi:predicted pyridoxine 5'-phosphate oxidase superfamily flavin-nucleotide-binding protein
MRWAELETGAPDLAAAGREQLEQAAVALIGTLRKDGSPRISCIQPCILDSELYLGMMWRSRKAVDLLRDPRLVVHNAVCTNAGDEHEFSVRGRAVEVNDREVRARYVEAVAERTTWKEPHFHLFSIEIEGAALVKYERGEQYVKVWPQGTEYKRPYG